MIKLHRTREPEDDVDTGWTRRFDCQTGVEVRRAKAKKEDLEVTIGARSADGIQKISIRVASGNPLITPSADIHINVDLVVDYIQGTLFLKGKLDEFPSFEAYLRQGQTVTELFTIAPEYGATPLNLLGFANVPVERRAQNIWGQPKTVRVVPARSYVALGSAASALKPSAARALASEVANKVESSSEESEKLKQQLFFGTSNPEVADSPRQKRQSRFISANVTPARGLSPALTMDPSTLFPVSTTETFELVLEANTSEFNAAIGKFVSDYVDSDISAGQQLLQLSEKLASADPSELASAGLNSALDEFKSQLSDAIPPEFLKLSEGTEGINEAVLSRLAANVISRGLDLRDLVDQAPEFLSQHVQKRFKGLVEITAAYSDVAENLRFYQDLVEGEISIADPETLLIAAADFPGLSESNRNAVRKVVTIYEAAKDLQTAGRNIRTSLSFVTDSKNREQLRNLFDNQGQKELSGALRVAEVAESLNQAASSIYAAGVALGLKGKDQKHAAEALKVINDIAGAASAYASGGYAGLAIHAVGFLAKRKSKNAPDPAQKRFEAIMQQFDLVHQKLNTILKNQGTIIRNQQQLAAAVAQASRKTHEKLDEIYVELERIARVANNLEQAALDEFVDRLDPLIELDRQSSEDPDQNGSLYRALKSYWNRPREDREELWSAMKFGLSRFQVRLDRPTPDNLFPAFMLFDTEGLGTDEGSEYEAFQTGVYKPTLDYFLENVSAPGRQVARLRSLEHEYVRLAEPTFDFSEAAPREIDALNESMIRMPGSLRFTALDRLLNPKTVSWSAGMGILISTLNDFVDRSADSVTQSNFILKPSAILNRPVDEQVSARQRRFLSGLRAAVEACIAQLTLLAGDSLLRIGLTDLQQIESPNAVSSFRLAVCMNPIFRDNLLRLGIRKQVSGVDGGFKLYRELLETIEQSAKEREPGYHNLGSTKESEKLKKLLPFPASIYLGVPLKDESIKPVIYVSFGPKSSLPSWFKPGSRSTFTTGEDRQLIVQIPSIEEILISEPRYPGILAELLSLRQEIDRRLCLAGDGIRITQGEDTLNFLLRNLVRA